MLRLYSKEQYLNDHSCVRDCQQFTSESIDISGRLVVPAIAGKLASHYVLVTLMRVLCPTMLHQHCRSCISAQLLAARQRMPPMCLAVPQGTLLGFKRAESYFLMCICRR